ncbi:MAG: Heterodisulfide reductase subunit B-like protein [Candidatus Bipolaricaulis sibiricus]|uniref:Heterodisulfide reductase subunit B-like protein n=1 Tax=Bipolaricaulis sibiricus TaxID=2501609 RepID=A0A410FS44_BIPS1|nr:MAG: Heterodisulfide reductase subunit B-like protein [Candidatus Bipolaricaulis sibiricus]
MPANPLPVTRHPSRLAYFPGCAMKDQARADEAGTLHALALLGYEIAEIPRWNCCGTVYSLAQDDLMRHVGPVRNLVRVQGMGERRVLTLCAMCYGTLTRSARFVQEPERLQRINAFMDTEDDFRGGIEVVHLLTLLRDEVGYEKLAARVKRTLDGLKVATYYGCVLLRPREFAVDDPDRPEVMERVVEALGGTPVAFPERMECCGAYLTVGRTDIVGHRVERILRSARSNGADVVVTTCPLCQFNLDERRPAGAPSLPVLYLGQLLAWAMGADEPAVAALVADERSAGRLVSTGV